jgi:hypothetical protein
MKASKETRFEPNRLPSYSEVDIINEIRRVVGLLDGRVPNPTKFERVARMSLMPIYKRFGDYANAIEQAGFTTQRTSFPNVARDVHAGGGAR